MTSSLDSITGVLVADDSQVVCLFVSKDWAESPGVIVKVMTCGLTAMASADFEPAGMLA